MVFWFPIIFAVEKYMLYLTSSVANRGSYINAIAVSVSIDFEYELFYN